MHNHDVGAFPASPIGLKPIDADADAASGSKTSELCIGLEILVACTSFVCARRSSDLGYCKYSSEYIIIHVSH